jgi:hypothetical protein
MAHQLHIPFQVRRLAPGQQERSFPMSYISQTNAGHFTTFFTSVAAGDVRVAGLPAGSAGSLGAPTGGLSTIAGLFAVGPDTAALMQAMIRPVAELQMAA